MTLVAIDVDGVVADLHCEWLKRYNADYNDRLSVDSIRVWGMHKVVKPECGRRIYDYLSDSTLYDNVPSIHLALAGIRRIRDANFKIVFVSSCVVGSMDAKARWLERHGFIDGSSITKKTFIACSDKHLIRADVLIDDYPLNLDEFPAKTVLFTQPWNLSAYGYARMIGWRDIDYLLDEIS